MASFMTDKKPQMPIRYKILIPSIPPQGEYVINREDMEEIAMKEKALREMRGNIITTSLYVEDALDTIIELALFSKEKRPVFRGFLYDKLAFGDKVEIIKDFLKNKIITLDNSDDTIRCIQEIVTIRNDFAHGNIFYEGKKPVLFTKGEKKTELNDGYFDKFNENTMKVLKILEKTIWDLRGENNTKTTGNQG